MNPVRDNQTSEHMLIEQLHKVVKLNLIWTLRMRFLSASCL